MCVQWAGVVRAGGAVSLERRDTTAHYIAFSRQSSRPHSAHKRGTLRSLHPRYARAPPTASSKRPRAAPSAAALLSARRPPLHEALRARKRRAVYSLTLKSISCCGNRDVALALRDYSRLFFISPSVFSVEALIKSPNLDLPFFFRNHIFFPQRGKASCEQLGMTRKND